jgi:hypothetical protein
MLKSINRNIAIILMIVGFFSFIPFFLTNEIAFKYEFYNYLILEIFIILIPFLLNKRKIDFFLSPSFIAVSYVNINFLLGSFFYANKMVFTKLLKDYDLWEFHSQRILFFNLINYVIILAFFINFQFKTKNFLLVDIKKIDKKLFLFITLVFFIFSIVVNPSFSFFGGSGHFSIMFKTLFGIFLLVYVSRTRKLLYRLFLYFLILITFVLFSIQDKRDAFFLILPIVLLEYRRITISLSIKKVLIIIVSFIMILYSLIAMSILRGYGYKTNSFVEALTLVDDYVQSDWFFPAIANNLEISQTYLHSNNVVEYIYRDKLHYLKGETFIKPLFVVVPRTIYKHKPRSAIDHYTTVFDYSFRKRGGSYVISIQSEFFLNFGWLSLILVFLFFTMFNGLYYLSLDLINNDNIINYIHLLYAYELFLALVRGSGLDIFTVSMLIFLFFLIGYKLFIKVLVELLKFYNK